MPALRLIGILFLVFGALAVADGFYSGDMFRVAGGLGCFVSGFVLMALDKIVSDIAAIRASVERKEG